MPPQVESVFAVGRNRLIHRDLQGAGQTLRDYRDLHRGESILVLGCGSSLPEVVAPERFTSIGVNDVERLVVPDYLVVLNPASQFPSDRFATIRQSQARAIFSQLPLPFFQEKLVRFRLGRRGGTDVSSDEMLPYTRNSPYVAACLAMLMGASRIGLIGVDFTDDHFFGATGKHRLAPELPRIEAEYAALRQAALQRGCELWNLSARSRLDCLPRVSPQEFARSGHLPTAIPERLSSKKVFFVHYAFLSCGDVFEHGLQHAAEDLHVPHQAAYWDDPELERKITAFSADLLFVVHGRRMARRHAALARRWPSAVWLLDEPYEVDDSSRYAEAYAHTFLNDGATLSRHRNASVLPPCSDPHAHWYTPGPREHAVGFVGGGNPRRESMLDALATAGLLSYVCGGPWRSSRLQQLSLGSLVPPARTAELYRETRIVVNCFRTAHHFNRQGIVAEAMPPRVYEALGCGALVISEPRAEILSLCPSMPIFRSAEELVAQVEHLLAHPAEMESVRRECIRALASHTYAQRLRQALQACFAKDTLREAKLAVPPPGSATRNEAPCIAETPSVAAASLGEPPESTCSNANSFAADSPEWQAQAGAVHVGEDDELLLQNDQAYAPGSERGLAGTEWLREASLEFELWLEPETEFLAKVYLQRRGEGLANSYHLQCGGGRGVLARHGVVLGNAELSPGSWHAVALASGNGYVHLWIGSKRVAWVQDDTLAGGYCFLGTKRGQARVRNIRLRRSMQHLDQTPTPEPALRCLYEAPEPAAPVPALSIVTTVFDRVQCLERCLRSVEALEFRDYEHIVVADNPEPAVLQQIRDTVERQDAGRGKVQFATLEQRTNNWGIAPAAAGLQLARGEFVCFLSDDNGYLPDHFEPLLGTLRADPTLGFAYSSCRYDGRLILAGPPRACRIDLGQPLFRRDLFTKHLDGKLPFNEFCWDWRMIETFLRKGVRWRHINRPTFLFRLEKYPEFHA